MHIGNKGKDILIICEGQTQGLHDTTLKAAAKYPNNFTQRRKSLHYKASNNVLFVNAAKIFQFKAKGSEIKDYTICLGNISKDFTINSTQDEPSQGCSGMEDQKGPLLKICHKYATMMKLG